MQKLVPRLAWLCAICTAGGMAWLPPASAAPRVKDPLPEAPPPAQPLAVKVRRGEPIEIPLRIYGQKNEALRYLIRTVPAHGRLTEPRVVEREVSAVTYTPPADLAVTRDRFSYAVQNSAGVSAAVDVSITILDQPPDLALPAAVDFASVLVGATAAKSVEISNRGGGLAEGRVEVEPPWKIEGPQKYRLGAGARAAFKIVFAPEQGGSFESALRFSSQPEMSVPVRGEAREAITAAPAKIVLQNAEGDAVRTGGFELTNQTDEERRVMLTGGARVQLPAEVLVPALGKIRVPVQTAANDVAELEAEILAQSDGLTVRIPLRAARVGALLRSLSGPINFGRVDAAKAASASFELENFGGTATTATWEIGAPFLIKQSSAVLAPGEKRTLTLHAQPAPAGKYRAWLTVKTDRQKLELPVAAELVGKAAPAAPVRLAGAPRAVLASSESAAPESAASEPSGPEPPAPELPFSPNLQVDLFRPEGVGLTDLAPTRVTLSWPAALSAATKFRLESRQVIADAAGELRVRWDEIPRLTVQRAGGNFSTVIRGLRADTAYGVRVVPLGLANDAAKPLFTQYFVTPQKTNWWPDITPVRLLLVCLAVIAAFIARERRREKRAR